MVTWNLFVNQLILLCLFSSVAQDHDIKGKTTTFEAEHKECIRVLPYKNASGQVYVQLYVFCDKKGIPKELKAAAQEFFEETGVELRWTNLFHNTSKKPSIASEDFKQLEVSQVNVVSKIIKKNLPVFSKHRNITAIQPSLKVTNSKQTNDPCIRVYVLGKGRIPVGESEIPNSVQDCPVDIVDGFWLETSDTPKFHTAHKQQKYLRLGASIGVKESNSFGTLGAILKDNDDAFYLLSCDHVIKSEVTKEITHPAWCHYLAYVDYCLTDYHNWINRITGGVDSSLQDSSQREDRFRHLRKQVDSYYDNLKVPRHKKLRECERKLYELFSEPPRTVAHYIDGIRMNTGFPTESKVYIDAAVAELIKEEEKALRENGYIEIIDTANYPDGNLTMDMSENDKREWHKSGSCTGYTSLKGSMFLGEAFLRVPDHERPSHLLRSFLISPEEVSDDVWRRNCLLFHHENLFSFQGDSGAVIFEKTEPQPQAMPGFGIVIGTIFSGDKSVGTIAVPLGDALYQLSVKLRKSLTLVSKLEVPSHKMEEC